jgi:hypothetical protein
MFPRIVTCFPTICSYYPGITLSFCKFSMTSPSSLSR